MVLKPEPEKGGGGGVNDPPSGPADNSVSENHV